MASSFGDKLKAFGQKITGQAPPPEPESLPQTLLRQVDEATTLTWKQRAIGFAITFGVGILLAFLSLTFLWTLQLTKFAVLYSFGSVLSLLSTMFLVGPVKQCKNMVQPHRALATAVYLAAIAGTLTVAFSVSGIAAFVLVIFLLVIQFIAFIWYALTYVPGGQDFLKRMVFRG